MISRDFELYYYKDKHFSTVESHCHDYYEFYFFQEGAVSIQIGNKTYPLSSGDIILIPPHINHHVIIHESSKSYGRFVFWMSEPYYSRLLSQSPDYSYLVNYVHRTKQYIFHSDAASFNSIQTRLFSFIEELHSERFGKDTRLFLCTCDLLMHVNRLIYEKNHPVPVTEHNNLYYGIIQYIDEHLSETLTLDRIASAFFLSKYHISHVFKENIGMPVGQYITKKRLHACREAILNQEDVGEACLRFGFCDYSSFYRAFKKEYGMSPREYKASHSTQLSNRQPSSSIGNEL